MNSPFRDILSWSNKLTLIVLLFLVLLVPASYIPGDLAMYILVIVLGFGGAQFCEEKASIFRWEKAAFVAILIADTIASTTTDKTLVSLLVRDSKVLLGSVIAGLVFRFFWRRSEKKQNSAAPGPV